MSIIVREIPQIALDFISKEEGLMTHEYLDIAGHPTICVGHLIKKGEDFSAGATEEQCKAILKQDLLRAALSIKRLISVPLTENQYAALLSFTFNLGGGALQCSTLRSRLNRGEYLYASEEFPRWCWAGGRKVLSLYLRRVREQLLFLTL